MINPILHNYDMHVNNFIRFLRDKLHCRLVYQGPDQIRHHILQKTVYACSVYCKPKKYVKDIFPIMIGSRLDFAIRHRGLRSFDDELSEEAALPPFQDLDIGRGFFLIGGFLRHVPYFYTNDPTNTHVVQKSIVRVYSYNAQDRGKELSYYVTDRDGRRYGDVVVVHNDGSESSEDPAFFAHCPHPVHLTAYMSQLYRDDRFDIDHLGNKVVVSPGHLFTRLFIKYLYGPIREQDWKAVKSRTTLVCHSIETGCLLHVLSRKTVYFKEGRSAGKMTNEPHESHREIGANGEVFIEKSTGCYREVNSQTYPLNPFFLYIVVRQMSNKVNHYSVDPFHPSYEGWFCKLGIFETKNVGRTNMMVRETVVSTCDALDPVYQHQTPALWEYLRLEPETGSAYHVVVNEACVPVTWASFHRIDLFGLKHRFGQIECYVRGKFMVIRYKMGLIMKRVPGTDVWVTPYDEEFWARYFYKTDRVGEFLHSYIVDLNPFYKHNAFLKNILAFNALKNAILATTPRYALYFMDTVSAYRHAPTSSHVALMRPREDGLSPHFALLLPQVVVTYMSFMGLTQEDCIVKREDVRVFDCCRFYTLRFKVKQSEWVKFYPVRGDVDEESELLGTLVSGRPLEVDPYSIHVRVVKVSACEYRLYFSKKPFRVVQHLLTEDHLMVSVEQEHVSSTGDKLCSLHGQKGVIRVVRDVPLLEGRIKPDLLVNAYWLFRITYGQVKEAEIWGGGRDAKFVLNSLGKLMKGDKAFFGLTVYFPIAYLSGEHIYAPIKCNLDRVTATPVKGRSRQGGMKIGNMEVYALRGNGIGSILESKLCEHADRILLKPTVAVPKSAPLVISDVAFFKAGIQFQVRQTINFIKNNCV